MNQIPSCLDFRINTTIFAGVTIEDKTKAKIGNLIGITPYYKINLNNTDLMTMMTPSKEGSLFPIELRSPQQVCFEDIEERKNIIKITILNGKFLAPVDYSKYLQDFLFAKAVIYADLKDKKEYIPNMNSVKMGAPIQTNGYLCYPDIPEEKMITEDEVVRLLKSMLLSIGKTSMDFIDSTDSPDLNLSYNQHGIALIALKDPLGNPDGKQLKGKIHYISFYTNRLAFREINLSDWSKEDVDIVYAEALLRSKGVFASSSHLKAYLTLDSCPILPNILQIFVTEEGLVSVINGDLAMSIAKDKIASLLQRKGFFKALTNGTHTDLHFKFQ